MEETRSIDDQISNYKIYIGDLEYKIEETLEIIERLKVKKNVFDMKICEKDKERYLRLKYHQFDLNKQIKDTQNELDESNKELETINHQLNEIENLEKPQEKKQEINGSADLDFDINKNVDSLEIKDVVLKFLNMSYEQFAKLILAVRVYVKNVIRSYTNNPPNYLKGKTYQTLDDSDNPTYKWFRNARLIIGYLHHAYDDYLRGLHCAKCGSYIGYCGNETEMSCVCKNLKALYANFTYYTKYD